MSSEALTAQTPSVDDINLNVSASIAPPESVFQYERQDGTIEIAHNMQDAIARCPVLGKMAIESPAQLSIIFHLATLNNKSAAKQTEVILNSTNFIPGPEKKIKSTKAADSAGHKPKESEEKHEVADNHDEYLVEDILETIKENINTVGAKKEIPDHVQEIPKLDTTMEMDPISERQDSVLQPQEAVLTPLIESTKNVSIALTGEPVVATFEVAHIQEVSSITSLPPEIVEQVLEKPRAAIADARPSQLQTIEPAAISVRTRLIEDVEGVHPSLIVEKPHVNVIKNMDTESSKTDNDHPAPHIASAYVFGSITEPIRNEINKFSLSQKVVVEIPQENPVPEHFFASQESVFSSAEKNNPHKPIVADIGESKQTSRSDFHLFQEKIDSDEAESSDKDTKDSVFKTGPLIINEIDALIDHDIMAQIDEIPAFDSFDTSFSLPSLSYREYFNLPDITGKEAVTIDTIRRKTHEEQSLEQTLVQTITMLASESDDKKSVEFEDIIEDLASVFQKHSTDIESQITQRSLTSEMMEKSEVVLKFLGYEQPQEVLFQFITEHGEDLLVQSLEYLCNASEGMEEDTGEEARTVFQQLMALSIKESKRPPSIEIQNIGLPASREHKRDISREEDASINLVSFFESEQDKKRPPVTLEQIRGEAAVEPLKQPPLKKALRELINARSEDLLKPKDTMELMQIIDGLRDVLPHKKTANNTSQSKDKSHLITQEVAEKAIPLLRFLGYKKPEDALASCISEDGSDFLVQALGYLCEFDMDVRKQMFEVSPWSVAFPRTQKPNVEFVIPDISIKVLFLPAA